MTVPVLVTVLDTDGMAKAGLPVYAFDGTTYTGYSSTTDGNGQTVFSLPQGSYRFRADRNGTQFWSGETSHCTVPSCENADITVTILVTVTVANRGGQPFAGVPVYAFDGETYTGYAGTTGSDGRVTFTLPLGSYRFRADRNSTQFWSGEANHCTVPGCTSASISLPGGRIVSDVTIDYTYDPLREAPP